MIFMFPEDFAINEWEDHLAAKPNPFLDMHGLHTSCQVDMRPYENWDIP
jgi:hypothetical protein